MFAAQVCPSVVSRSFSYSQMIWSGIPSPSVSWMSVSPSILSPISIQRTIKTWNGVMLPMSPSINGSTHASKASKIASGWPDTASKAIFCMMVCIASASLVLFARSSNAALRASHSSLPRSALYAASKSPVPSNRVKFSTELNSRRYSPTSSKSSNVRGSGNSAV